MASLWEMQIKLQLGKLKLNTPLEELVKGQLEINMIDILDIKLEHILALGKMPSHHKDPFDRLIIAQAGIEEAIVLTKDKYLQNMRLK